MSFGKPLNNGLLVASLLLLLNTAYGENCTSDAAVCVDESLRCDFDDAVYCCAGETLVVDAVKDLTQGDEPVVTCQCTAKSDTNLKARCTERKGDNKNGAAYASGSFLTCAMAVLFSVFVSVHM